MLLSFPSVQILGNLTLNSHTNLIVKTPTENLLESSLIMSYLVLLFLLCLSMIACNARQLGAIRKDPGKHVYLFGEDVETTKLHDESSIPSRSGLRLSISEEVQTQHHNHQQQEVGKDERKTHESRFGANMMKEEDSKALLKEEEETKRATSGSERSEIIVSSSKEGLHKTTKTDEGWKRQARALLGSSPHDAEETVDSKEPSTAEDIVVTDYAQPHRKPPIHNEKP